MHVMRLDGITVCSPLGHAIGAQDKTVEYLSLPPRALSPMAISSNLAIA